MGEKWFGAFFAEMQTFDIICRLYKISYANHSFFRETTVITNASHKIGDSEANKLFEESPPLGSAAPIPPSVHDWHYIKE